MPRTQLYSPTTQLNGVLCIMRGLDFGLVEADYTIGNGLTKNFSVKTPVPMKVRVCITLASGDLSLTIDKNATGTYGSADVTQAVTGTSEVTAAIETDASNPWACIRLTENGAGSSVVISELYVEVSGMLPEGQDWAGSVRYAHNLLVGQVSTGIFDAAFDD